VQQSIAPIGACTAEFSPVVGVGKKSVSAIHWAGEHEYLADDAETAIVVATTATEEHAELRHAELLPAPCTGPLFFCAYQPEASQSLAAFRFRRVPDYPDRPYSARASPR
jgi:hypothetical protein